MKVTEEKQICFSCQGSGKCFKCSGTGNILQNQPTPIPVISGTVRGDSPTGTRRTCPKCYGSGVCPACKGTGKAA